jgi:hypothetical protein
MIMRTKYLLKLVLTVFVVMTLLDLSALVATNFKEFFTTDKNEIIYYLFKLIGLWFIFSILLSPVIFSIREFTRRYGKQNDHLDNVIFYLMCPFVFCIFILAAIGLQLRFFGGFFFPANFNDNFFALFGFSILLFVIGLIVFLLKIFVIKPSPSPLSLNLSAADHQNQNIFSLQFLGQRALPIVIGIIISKQYGLVSGLTVYFSVIILYEICRRLLKPKTVVKG